MCVCVCVCVQCVGDYVHVIVRCACVRKCVCVHTIHACNAVKVEPSTPLYQWGERERERLRLGRENKEKQKKGLCVKWLQVWEKGCKMQWETRRESPVYRTREQTISGSSLRFGVRREERQLYVHLNTSNGMHSSTMLLFLTETLS